MSGGIAPHHPLGYAPLRRPQSIRRTTSMQMTWPEGKSGALLLSGRARDLLTRQTPDSNEVLSEHTLMVRIASDRLIAEIAADPPQPALAALIGAHSISGLRLRVAETMAEAAAAGSPLYVLLDDIAGSSLISSWAWTRVPATRDAHYQSIAGKRLSMEGTCSGFVAGSLALAPADEHRQSSAKVPSVVHPDDPEGWHALPENEGVSMRRSRRIDVWREGDLIRIDSMFQDSASTADGGREAVHEYGLMATASRVTGTLIEVVADPRVLPYAQCPAAAANVHRLLGTPMRDLRARVLETLKRTAGCTHLNDAMRALAEVPQLAAQLEAQR